jgi:hypothetical protein
MQVIWGHLAVGDFAKRRAYGRRLYPFVAVRPLWINVIAPSLSDGKKLRAVFRFVKRCGLCHILLFMAPSNFVSMLLRSSAVFQTRLFSFTVCSSSISGLQEQSDERVDFGQRDGLNFDGAGVKVILKRVAPSFEDRTDVHIQDLRPVTSTSGVDGGRTMNAMRRRSRCHRTFSRNPHTKGLAFARAMLNPYLTVILTFLSTISKHAATLAILDRPIPLITASRALYQRPS